MEKNLNSANVYNLIILDESGSMRSIYSESLAAINEAIKGIRSNQSEFPQQRQFVSIVTFAGRGMDGMKVRRDRVPVMRVRDMTVQDYRPGGGTPLYDTMGRSSHPGKKYFLASGDNSMRAIIIFAILSAMS